MAQKIQTLFIDDLDGSQAEGTVRFGLDGTHYEIDLNAVHAKELRKKDTADVPVGLGDIDFKAIIPLAKQNGWPVVVEYPRVSRRARSARGLLARQPGAEQAVIAQPQERRHVGNNERIKEIQPGGRADAAPPRE